MGTLELKLPATYWSLWSNEDYYTVTVTFGKETIYSKEPVGRKDYDFNILDEAIKFIKENLV